MRKPAANTSIDNINASNIGQAPSNEELDAVLRVITSELSIASKVHDLNNRLWTAIAKNVAKTVRYNVYSIYLSEISTNILSQI